MRLILAMLTALALTSGAARADAPALDGVFGLWLGGFKLGEISMRTQGDAAGWSVDGAARTGGVLGWVMTVESRGEARGTGDARRPRSDFYRVEGDFGDGPQWIEMRRNARGGLDKTAQPAQRERYYNAEPEDLIGALDPLTAGLAVIGRAPAAQICNRTVPVFDSRRRFDLILGPPREENGDLLCDGRYHRVAGYKDKHLRLPDAPFTLHWSQRDGMARFEKMVAPTDLGAAVLRRVEE